MKRVVNGLAIVLLLIVLLAPSEFDLLFTPASFLRLPLDGLLAVTLVLLLPPRARPAASWIAGGLLGVLAVLKLTCIGFSSVLGRPFDVVMDWVFLEAGVAFLGRSIGGWSKLVVAGVIVVAAGLALLVTLAFRRVAGLLARDRVVATRSVAMFACAWVACAVTGAGSVPGVPLAGHDLYDQAVQVGDGLRDHEIFARLSDVDAFRDVPGDALLESLRGKDVVVALVESYGRNAVAEMPLDQQSQRLSRLGYDSRSGWLTSPVVGGGSWLAQDTLLSGLWVNSAQRHKDLLAGDRFTLNKAFKRAGWRTVALMPANTLPWPEGAFFGYDKIYAEADLGYRGPKFAFNTVPDQFTLSTFQRLERASPEPVMAVIPLISSHAPWRPVPQLTGWETLGDGASFTIAPGTGSPGQIDLSGSRAQIRADYLRAVHYSIDSVVSYVERYGDDDLVVVLLGDHQPAPIVTGSRAGRDVPISVISRDPAVIGDIAGWGWQPGLRPGEGTPVWRMDTFRDRFLSTFSSRS